MDGIAGKEFRGLRSAHAGKASIQKGCLFEANNLRNETHRHMEARPVEQLVRGCYSA